MKLFSFAQHISHFIVKGTDACQAIDERKQALLFYNFYDIISFISHRRELDD